MAVLSSFRGFIFLLAFTSCALAVHERVFTAARKHPNLRRRDQSPAPTYDGNTVYFDDGMLAGAQVKLEPSLPMLVLEDIDDQIASIDCSESTIVVHFQDLFSFDTALSAWSNQTNFAIVTNHNECQTAGEHGVWRVQVASNDSQIFAITLSGHSTNLRDVSPRMTIELGKHVSDRIDTSSLLARQDGPTNTGTFTTSQTPTATFSYSSPTTLATGSSLSSDISFSDLNTTLLPPDSSIVDLIPHSGILEDIRLSCRNCTLTGNIELVAGGFTINDTDAEMLSDFINNGYLKFNVSDLSATMDFELAFLPGFSIFEFTAQLPSIPLGAIVIANVLKFGPVLDLTFPIAVNLNSPVTLRTGFTLTAPPVASIYLNMSDSKSSYTTGFSQTTLKALPFTADAKGLSMNLTTGFKPQLVLGAGVGADVFNASASGGIGVYLDLPQLTATLDVVDGADQKCEPTLHDPQNGLIRVNSSVTYGGGAEWDLDIDVLGVGYQNGEEVPWLSNTTALPTQCLMWDEKIGSLVDAAVAMTSGQAGDAGSDTASTRNAASTLSSVRVLGAAMCLTAILCTNVIGW